MCCLVSILGVLYYLIAFLLHLVEVIDIRCIFLIWLSIFCYFLYLILHILPWSFFFRIYYLSRFLIFWPCRLDLPPRTGNYVNQCIYMPSLDETCQYEIYQYICNTFALIWLIYLQLLMFLLCKKRTFNHVLWFMISALEPMHLSSSGRNRVRWLISHINTSSLWLMFISISYIL